MAAQSGNVLITGANRGLGLEMVGQMVKGSVPVHKLIACCRDPDGPRAEVSPELLYFALDSLPQQFCSLCHQHVKTIVTNYQAGNDQKQVLCSLNHI